MKNDMFWNAVKESVNLNKARSAWSRGVKDFALDMVDAMQETAEFEGLSPKDVANDATSLAIALNGAKDWKQYSWSGCGLIYDGDICESLCSPSEIKRYKGGELHPSGEEWLDVQARALFQAFRMVRRAIHGVVA